MNKNKIKFYFKNGFLFTRSRQIDYLDMNHSKSIKELIQKMFDIKNIETKDDIKNK